MALAWQRNSPVCGDARPPGGRVHNDVATSKPRRLHLAALCIQSWLATARRMARCYAILRLEFVRAPDSAKRLDLHGLSLEQ